MPMNETWLRHIRARDVIAFPRDYTLYRRKLLTERQYLTVCWNSHKNRLELFTSVYSQYEIDNCLASTLFYDLDLDYNIRTYNNTLTYNVRIINEDDIGRNILLDNILQLVSLHNSLLESTRSLYTGHRGVHIYVDLTPVRVQDLRGAAVFVAELLGIKDYVDKLVLGDWKRLSRVPGSFHAKTGEECIVINAETNGELKDILTKIVRDKFGSKSNTSFKVHIPDEHYDKVMTLGEPPPCILYLLGRLFAGQELSHQARLHLAAYLLRLGLTPEEAAILYSSQPDYNMSVTLYQLRWLQERDYKMYSCPKARELGLCPLPLQHCKYYPSANWWF